METLISEAERLEVRKVRETLLHHLAYIKPNIHLTDGVDIHALICTGLRDKSVCPN